MNDRNEQGVTVRHHPDKSRFDVLLDDVHAGFSMYEDLGADSARQRIFYYTVVFDEFEGRGLDSILARIALDASVRARHRIVAVCPYIKAWLSTHRDFDDAVDPVSPEHVQALR
ncbi:GNAT family N-acetyltransferase [Streptomyces sp. NPDC002701]|uniref:GNAT family N-acetyltransferase n=1 Tax=Streptomyces sp. NPDC002701 TaxID=3364661 RepID=UPI0036C4589C